MYVACDVRTGYMAGISGQFGTDYLCLPEQPQWTHHSTKGNVVFMYGFTYDFSEQQSRLFSTANNTSHRKFLNKPVTCAVCYVSQRSTSVMMPASTSCPVGWTQEYAGYIMSASGRFICVDKTPELASGRDRYGSGDVIYVVKVECGVLPCSSYRDDWVLTCIVCTK